MNDRKDALKNVAASVRDRLKTVMASTGQDYNTLLTRYTIERFLFRLSESEYRNRFVLKGALLFALWNETPHRVTRDLDLLGFGDSSSEELEAVFAKICACQVPDDGVIFDSASVKAEPIRAQELYVGVRLNIQGMIGSARTLLQIDVGFGDATAVQPVEVEFPSLLEDMPAAWIRAYRMESALAEKYEAAVTLGLLNSRMKDYYDFYFLGNHSAFDGQELADSIRATFERRGTVLPVATPAGFSAAFWNDPGRQAMWKSFWRKSVKLDPMLSLEQVVSFAAGFLLPPALAAAEGRPFSSLWKPGGSWKEK
jgi:hypothetical protein